MKKKQKKVLILFSIFSSLIVNISLNYTPVNANNKNEKFLDRNYLSPGTESTTQKTLLARTGCRVNQFETEVFRLTNQVRQRYGLRPLRWNCRLISAAQKHSRDMAKCRRLSHRGCDGSTMVSRARSVGYRYSRLTENVAAGQRSPQSVVNSWMKSQGHRKNILDPQVTEIGIGYSYVSQDRYKTYWTQVFGRR